MAKKDYWVGGKMMGRSVNSKPTRFKVGLILQETEIYKIKGKTNGNHYINDPRYSDSHV